MSDPSAWLAGRRPEPPEDLARALAFQPRAAVSGSAVEALAAEGRARLARARAELGRVRESAFRLLEADALVTYACEAALEQDDPESALRRIFLSTSAS
ncbi:MAG: hypothetical protein AB7T31_08190 [Gemmatimonadales bacterium]